MSITWDRWIGNLDGEPVYFQKVLARWTWRGILWTLRLHKFVKADNPGCFHTHPAHAYRLVLWGGYVEEIYKPEDPYWGPARTWTPGDYGYVAPSLCHRVHQLINGRTSYSLWLHGPKVASIELHGPGWPDNIEPHFSAKRVRVEPTSTPVESSNK